MYCGLEIDRDLNAALNLKQLGKAFPEVTPVNKKALVLNNIENATILVEAGIKNKDTCVNV